MVRGDSDMAGKLKEIAASLKNARALFSEPMKNHTSFKIGGPCDLLIIPSTEEDALNAWALARKLEVPCYVIGNGTNLLVRDGGVRGCVIKMAPAFSGIERIGERELLVKSGTLLSHLVETSREYGLSGLEFAVGIPGSAGGAVSMNAGAYNGEMGALVTEVKVGSRDKEVSWLSRDELEFSYRHSLFSNRDDLLILSAKLKLSPGDKDRILEVMSNYARERAAKQPLELPSAGSAFRRPEGKFVGPMIEALGLKGFSCGGAQISLKHAGFIVNTGNATAKDVLCLMDLVKEKVKKEFGVDLEPEIVVIGEDLP